MRLNSYRLRGLLIATLALALQAAASAHFVWIEPADAPNGVRVCFGEYPGKEGSPLLERIDRTRTFAVDAAGRRELKPTRKGDHYLCDGMGAAPVAAAILDYGILQRGDTAPYLLRYESQLLRGESKPLTVGQVAELSKLDAGLPLSVELEAAGPSSLRMQVRLHGKPVAGQVTTIGPGAEPAAQAIAADGKATLAIDKGGTYYVRVKAEDDKPVSFEGPEGKKSGKFTRTYLSLVFNAAEPPAAAGQPDAEAVKLLDDAHAARAGWGKDFPGFTADAAYRLNGREARGTITVAADFTIKYNLGDKELEKALNPSFASLIMHRRGGEPPHYAATWRDSAPHPLGPAINLNDDLGSFYRVRDRQIMQVNRKMGSQRFTNNVLENESSKFGFLPRAWTIAYYDNDTNALLKVSTTRVTWKWLGDVFLPGTVEVSAFFSQGADTSQLVLTNQRLLQ